MQLTSNVDTPIVRSLEIAEAANRSRSGRSARVLERPSAVKQNGGTADRKRKIDASRSGIESRQAWIIALAALAITSISYGSPLVAVVALKPIAAEFGGLRSIPALASSLVWLGSGIGAILMAWFAELFLASEASWRVSVLYFCSILGMAVGGWMAGLICDRDGYYAPAFLVAIVFNLANLAVIGSMVFRQLVINRPTGAKSAGSSETNPL